MPEETNSSNLDNNTGNDPSLELKKSEEKNSSISEKQVPDKLLDDSKTNQAVDDIVKQEGDELLSIHTEPKTEKPQKRWQAMLKNKKIVIPALIIAVLLVIFAVPQSRYKILGLFLKEKYDLVLTDSQTGNPVSDATVTLSGQTVTTNNKGQANLKSKVGYSTLTINKKYYKALTANVLVPLSQKAATHFKLQATGRQVSLKVVNLISGAPISNAKISADGTTATTDNMGQALIVLPAGQSSTAATIKTSGYNDLSAKITITNKTVAANTFKQTPAGRIYFLSNLSGNIDVVSTNLDGTGRQTVLAGTGNEDPNNTVLLATRDWKYLALLSKRNGGQNAELFLINTSNDQLTTIDSGNAAFTPVGWSGDNFVYEAAENGLSYWQAGNTKIKSYNADTGKLTTIDQSSAHGSQNSYISDDISFVNLVGDNKVVYGFTWSSNGSSLAGQKDSIVSANTDGSDKQSLRDISLTSSTTFSYMSAVVYQPQTLYVQFSSDSSNDTYYAYSYENNSVSQSNTLTSDTFVQYQQNYSTYLESPSGSQTFWSEPRDGKNTLFVGDYYGQNGKQIATLSDYTPYGWYTGNYLLVEKNGSELYIMPTSGGQALKISDYYKPAHNYYGYGGGYGGL